MTDSVVQPNEETRKSRKRLVFLLPVTLFIALAVALAWGLTRDPGELPSVLIGKPVPEFALPPVQGRTLGLSSDDLQGEVSLITVFASWCTACRESSAERRVGKEWVSTCRSR